MRLVSRVAAVSVLAASLGGCIFFSSPADQAVRRSPSFKDGYADGCAAAQEQGSNFRGSPVVDKTLYDTDKIYRAGWASGWQTCRPTERQPGAAPGDSPLPNTIPGQH
jgi:hypothetical protein